MKLVFISNAITPHQISLCEQLNGLCSQFVFLETIQTDADLPIGWKQDGSRLPYVRSKSWLSEDPQRARALIMDADVVMFGSVSEQLVVERLRANKLTFRYSERFYKQKRSLWQLPRDFLAAWKHHGRYRRYPLYMLCASAYTAVDAARFGNYKGRCYKWGYFPRTIVYDDVEQLLDGKEPNRLLWVGRMLDWKHPEAPVEVARRLAEQGRDFHLDMIGTGPMEQTVRELVSRYGLSDRVTLLGSKIPDEVRAYMERASIYLFTSDRGEGWGAVLNESMNSGCAVVASDAIGSAPFLLRDGVNGCLYADGDTDMLYSKVARLLDEPEPCRALGRAAYRTITEEWNANHAAERLLALSKAILGGEDAGQLFESGPCSRASALPESG